MLDAIAKPFGILLLWLYNLVSNYGIAVFLFALIVKLIMLPFQMKTKKSMMRMAALNPQIQELQKRHEGNPQKLQQETSKLYKEEHVNPMSGCLWSLIPYPILLALYRAIRFPLTTMMGVPKTLLEAGGALSAKLAEFGFVADARNAYVQLTQSQLISEKWAEFDWTTISDKLQFINYKFLGLNMGDTPKVFFWNDGVNWMSFGLFLIPIVSAVLSWLQMKVSTKTNPAPQPQNAQQASSAKTMNLMMPLISLWICFSMPAALGMYWIFTSLLAMVQELILNKHYGKLIAAEAEAREARQREREAEWERKRQETERLRAEGKTQENANTSKKKQQARAKAEMDELKAAAIREERAAKRAALGIQEEEKPASQVGNRRYARGRAYVEDRFTNPEAAAEATAAAAAESENAPSIDEAVEESEVIDIVTEAEATAEETAETVEEREAVEAEDAEAAEAESDEEEE